MNFGDSKKLSRVVLGRGGGGYFEYRLPGFPDFGPQSLATLHNSISSSSKQQPRQVFARIR